MEIGVGVLLGAVAIFNSNLLRRGGAFGVVDFNSFLGRWFESGLDLLVFLAAGSDSGVRSTKPAHLHNSLKPIALRLQRRYYGRTGKFESSLERPGYRSLAFIASQAEQSITPFSRAETLHRILFLK